MSIRTRKNDMDDYLDPPCPAGLSVGSTEVLCGEPRNHEGAHDGEVALVDGHWYHVRWGIEMARETNPATEVQNNPGLKETRTDAPVPTTNTTEEKAT